MGWNWLKPTFAYVVGEKGANSSILIFQTSHIDTVGLYLDLSVSAQIYYR